MAYLEQSSCQCLDVGLLPAPPSKASWLGYVRLRKSARCGHFERQQLWMKEPKSLLLMALTCSSLLRNS